MLISAGGVAVVKIKPQKCPVDYSLCNQTVTVYRASFENNTFSCIKTVSKNAFMDFKKVQNTDKTGSKESNSFLLIIPGEADLKKNDKVLFGEGEDITTREEWAKFIPANRMGLCVVDYVDPKYWQNEICHTEAGG